MNNYWSGICLPIWKTLNQNIIPDVSVCGYDYFEYMSFRNIAQGASIDLISRIETLDSSSVKTEFNKLTYCLVRLRMLNMICKSNSKSALYASPKFDHPILESVSEILTVSGQILEDNISIRSNLSNCSSIDRVAFEEGKNKVNSIKNRLRSFWSNRKDNNKSSENNQNLGVPESNESVRKILKIDPSYITDNQILNVLIDSAKVAARSSDSRMPGNTQTYTKYYSENWMEDFSNNYNIIINKIFDIDNNKYYYMKDKDILNQRWVDNGQNVAIEMISFATSIIGSLANFVGDAVNKHYNKLKQDAKQFDKYVTDYVNKMSKISEYLEGVILSSMMTISDLLNDGDWMDRFLMCECVGDDSALFFWICHYINLININTMFKEEDRYLKSAIDLEYIYGESNEVTLEFGREVDMVDEVFKSTYYIDGKIEKDDSKKNQKNKIFIKSGNICEVVPKFYTIFKSIFEMSGKYILYRKEYEIDQKINQIQRFGYSRSMNNDIEFIQNEIYIDEDWVSGVENPIKISIGIIKHMLDGKIN